LRRFSRNRPPSKPRWTPRSPRGSAPYGESLSRLTHSGLRPPAVLTRPLG
jgi:hypothetical protein